MQNSTAVAPSPNSDAFAAFLARLSSLAESGPGGEREALPQAFPTELTDTTLLDTVAEAGLNWESEPEPDWAALSYENALRAPSSAPAGRNANKIASPAITAAMPFSTSALITEKGEQTGLALTTQPAPRTARTTIRLSVEENSLIHSRATETGLTVSSYIRACVMEVESLREQVRRMAQERNPELRPVSKSAAPKSSAFDAEPISLPHAPVQPALTAPSFSEVLAQLSENLPGEKTPQPASQPAPRPRQALTARTPEHPPHPRHTDSRVQAALEAERVRIESRAGVGPARAAAPAPEPKRGLLSFLFGSRRGAQY